MIKLITFDLDNTLWNADPVIIKAEQVLYTWLQENCPDLALNYSMQKMLDYKAAIASANPDLKHRVSALRLEVLKRALSDVGYSENDSLAIAKQAFSAFHIARQKVTLFDHVHELLTSLSNRYQLAALTNGNADVSIIGLDHYFEFALSADDVGRQKPEPEMFLEALSKANVKADETIHIGDHPEHDIMGAQNAGMHTIWVNFDAGTRWVGPTTERGKTEPSKIANCLSEIPKLIRQIENSMQN